MKRRISNLIILLLAVVIVASSCVSATEIPINASSEQIERINAQNLVATAKNTATLTGVTLASVALAVVSSLISVFSFSAYY